MTCITKQKQILKVSNKQAEIYIGNNIEYDVKSSQFKVTIVNRKKIRVKDLQLTVHRKTVGMANEYLIN